MHILSNQRGATLVYVALTTIVLLMFLGLATDAGVLVFVRTQSQARVDSAALAAAAGLVKPLAVDRQNTATRLANTFSGQNAVVDNATNPANVVEPMHYDTTSGVITTATDWSPGTKGENCNAVRVSTTVPTPVYFSGVRSWFGGDGNPSVNIPVGAVSHLPCPGILNTGTAAGIAPLALRQCSWTFPQDCDTPQRLWEQSQPIDNAMWITYNLPNANQVDCSNIADNDGVFPPGFTPIVKVGDTVSTNNGQVTPCLRTLRTAYQNCTPARCAQEPADPACTVVIPIVDCAGPQSSATVVGFASICFTGFDPDNAPKWVDGSLECGEVAPSSGGSGGICLGTYASNPVLVK